MIYSIIVLYNKFIENSQSFSVLDSYVKKEKKQYYKIIVYDNSVSSFGTHNAKICNNLGVKYLGNGSNIGLAKAYNCAIDCVPDSAENYVMILDDDTMLTDQYLQEVSEKQLNKEFEVMLPIVKSFSKGSIYSPCKFNDKFRAVPVKDIKRLSKAEITAINSGMVIRRDIFRKVKYNENLFVDYIDHDFMRKLTQLKVNFTILNNEIIQNIANDEEIDVNKALQRFMIFYRDYKIYCFECNKKIFYYVSIFRIIIKKSIKYKSALFFKLFLNNK